MPVSLLFEQLAETNKRIKRSTYEIKKAYEQGKTI